MIIKIFLYIFTGFSAPNTRPTTPTSSPRMCRRSSEDLSLNLKRSRISSDSCPLSPSREPPTKIFYRSKEPIEAGKSYILLTRKQLVQ